MALTSSDEREALLEIAAQRALSTSYARRLAQQPTLYDHQKRQQSSIFTLSEAIAPPPGSAAAEKKKVTDVKIVSQLPKGRGFQPSGHYSSVRIDFALGPQGDNEPDPPFATEAEQEERDEWGLHFGNPLTNPRKSTIYMVRATVSLLHTEPLASGVILKWLRASGWTWVDGQPGRTIVQVSSNPIVVIRLARSPSTTIRNNSGFSCSVVAQYL